MCKQVVQVVQGINIAAIWIMENSEYLNIMLMHQSPSVNRSVLLIDYHINQNFIAL